MNTKTHWTGSLRMLALGMSASLLGPIAANAEPNAGIQSADMDIERCLNASPDADAQMEQAIRTICVKAFNRAIAEAQNTERHSALRRDVYWAQASQINAIYVLVMLKQEKNFNEYICNLALQGVKAWNQIERNSAVLETMERPRTLDVAQAQCMQFWQG